MLLQIFPVPVKAAVAWYLIENWDTPFHFMEEDSVHSTFGIHPKHALEYDDAQQNVALLHLTTNLAKPKVVGIIEIGLDYIHAESRPDLPEAKDRQHQMQKKILLETRKMPVFASLPLVLHIRDVTCYKEEAHLDTIKILQECGVDSTHSIYLHCFVGSARMAQAWMDAYPEVKFGVSPKVLVPGHHKELPQVFWDVPLTRLLVETDSAAMSLLQVRRPRVSTPYHAIAIFKWLAALRGLGLGAVLRQVAKNYHSLYLIPTPKAGR